MYYLIANPAAKSGNHQDHALESLTRALKRAHIRYQICWTRRKGDPERIAGAITQKKPESGRRVDLSEWSDGKGQQAGQTEAEDDVIVVIGGDGTINGVLNGIRDFSAIRFGFLPAGSANDLGRGLGIVGAAGKKKDPAAQKLLIHHLVQGRVRRRMDLGQLSYGRRTRLFAVSAGIGFDAAVCRETAVSGTRRLLNGMHLGELSYGIIGLRQLLAAPRAVCRICPVKEGQESAALDIRELLFAAFMNTPYEGGGYQFAPDAVSNDGKLNAAAIGDLSKFTILTNFPSARRGTYYKVKGVHHTMASGYDVCTDRPLYVHIDGEVIGKLSSFSIRCLPGRLRLIV